MPPPPKNRHTAPLQPQSPLTRALARAAANAAKAAALRAQAAAKIKAKAQANAAIARKTQQAARDAASKKRSQTEQRAFQRQSAMARARVQARQEYERRKKEALRRALEIQRAAQQRKRMDQIRRTLEQQQEIRAQAQRNAQSMQDAIALNQARLAAQRAARGGTERANQNANVQEAIRAQASLREASKRNHEWLAKQARTLGFKNLGERGRTINAGIQSVAPNLYERLARANKDSLNGRAFRDNPFTFGEIADRLDRQTHATDMVQGARDNQVKANVTRVTSYDVSDLKTGKDLEAEMDGVLELARATRGAGVSDEELDAVAGQYSKYRQRVIDRLNKKSEQLETLLEKIEQAAKKRMPKEYDRLRKRFLDLYYSKDSKALRAEMKRLDKKLPGFVEDYNATVDMKNVPLLQQIAGDTNAAFIQFMADVKAGQGRYAKAWLPVLNTSSGSGGGAGLEFRPRTNSEYEVYMEQMKAHMTELESNNAKAQAKIAFAVTNSEEYKYLERWKVGRKLSSDQFEALLASQRGHAVPGIGLEIMDEWNRDNPPPEVTPYDVMEYYGAHRDEFPSGPEGAQSAVESAILAEHNEKRAEFERRLYAMLHTTPPGILEKTLTLPLVEGAIAAVGAIGGSVNAIGRFLSNPTGTNPTGVSLNNFVFGSAPIFKPVEYTPEQIAENKAATDELRAAIESGDAWRVARAASAFGGEPFGSGQDWSNFVTSMLIDPTNVIPLNFFRYPARVRRALQAVQENSGLSRLQKAGLGGKTFLRTSEETLRREKELTKILKEFEGVDVVDMKRELRAKLAGVSDPADAKSALDEWLQSHGLTPQPAVYEQLVGLTEDMVRPIGKLLNPELESDLEKYSRKAKEIETEEAIKEGERRKRFAAAKLAAEREAESAREYARAQSVAQEAAREADFQARALRQAETEEAAHAVQEAARKAQFEAEEAARKAAYDAEVAKYQAERAAYEADQAREASERAGTPRPRRPLSTDPANVRRRERRAAQRAAERREAEAAARRRAESNRVREARNRAREQHATDPVVDAPTNPSRPPSTRERAKIREFKEAYAASHQGRLPNQTEEAQFLDQLRVERGFSRERAEAVVRETDALDGTDYGAALTVYRRTAPSTDATEVQWMDGSRIKDTEEVVNLRAILDDPHVDDGVKSEAWYRLKQLAHDEEQRELLRTGQPQVRAVRQLEHHGARTTQQQAEVQNLIAEIDHFVGRTVRGAEDAADLAVDTSGRVVRRSAGETSDDVNLVSLRDDLADHREAGNARDFYRPFSGDGRATSQMGRGGLFRIDNEDPWDSLRDYVKNGLVTRPEFVKLLHARARIMYGKTGSKAFQTAVNDLFEIFHMLRLDGDAQKLRLMHDVALRMAMRDPDGADVLIARTWLLMESRAGFDFALPFDVIENMFMESAAKFGMVPQRALGMFPGQYETRAVGNAFGLNRELSQLYEQGLGGTLSHRPGATLDEMKAANKPLFHRLFTNRNANLPMDRFMKNVVAHIQFTIANYQNAASGYMRQTLLNLGYHDLIRNGFGGELKAGFRAAVERANLPPRLREQYLAVIDGPNYDVFLRDWTRGHLDARFNQMRNIFQSEIENGVMRGRYQFQEWRVAVAYHMFTVQNLRNIGNDWFQQAYRLRPHLSDSQARVYFGAVHKYRLDAWKARLISMPDGASADAFLNQPESRFWRSMGLGPTEQTLETLRSIRQGDGLTFAEREALTWESVDLEDQARMIAQSRDMEPGGGAFDGDDLGFDMRETPTGQLGDARQRAWNERQRRLFARSRPEPVREPTNTTTMGGMSMRPDPRGERQATQEAMDRVFPNQSRTGRDGTIETDMRAGRVEQSQQANIEEGIARGGTAESGGAMRADPPRPEPPPRLEEPVPPPDFEPRTFTETPFDRAFRAQQVYAEFMRTSPIEWLRMRQSQLERAIRRLQGPLRQAALDELGSVQLALRYHAQGADPSKWATFGTRVAGGLKILRKYGEEASKHISTGSMVYRTARPDQVPVEVFRSFAKRLWNTPIDDSPRYAIRTPALQGFTPALWEDMNERVTKAIREVQEESRVKLRTPSVVKQKKSKYSIMTDDNPVVVAQKKKALREFAQAHGLPQITVSEYDQIRSVLAGPLTRMGRTYRLMNKAGGDLDQFDVLARQAADAEGREQLLKMMMENPNADPEDIWQVFLSHYEMDGILRNSDKVLTPLQHHAIVEYARHISGGVDITDDYQAAQFLRSRDMAVPTDKRWKFSDFQKKRGAWTPRQTEDIIAGKPVWSRDQEKDYWMANFRMLPDWLTHPDLESGAALHDRALYHTVQDTVGSYDKDANAKLRLSGDLQGMTPEEYARGNPEIGLKPTQDIETQRNWARQYYGAQVWSDTDGFIAMPWLMNREEMGRYFKTRVRKEMDEQGYIVDEAQFDAFEKATKAEIDRRLPHFLRLITDRDPNAVFDNAAVHEFASIVASETLSTQAWRPFWRKDLMARGLDVWSKLWRGQVLMQLGFLMSNAVDGPLKTGVFGVTMARDLAQNGDRIIPHLDSIGEGNFTTLAYSSQREPLLRRVRKPRKGYVMLDVRQNLNAALDVYSGGLARFSGHFESYSKLRLARMMAAGMERDFGEKLLKQLGDQEAVDLVIRRVVKKRIQQLYPTLENAGELEKILNEISPFLSYTFKNNLLWISLFLENPVWFNRLRHMQHLMAEHNEQEWLKTHDSIEGMPANFATNLTFDLFGRTWSQDLGFFSDAARGLRAVTDPTKTIQQHITQFIRFGSPIQWATFNWVTDGLGITGRMTNVPILDKNGNPTGKYEWKRVPVGAPWSGKPLDSAELFWPQPILQFFQDALQGKQITGEQFVRVASKMMFFGEFDSVGPDESLFTVWADMVDADPKAANLWLNGTPEGARLKELWRARGLLEKKAYVDKETLALMSIEDSDPAKLRRVWEAGLTQQDRDALFASRGKIGDIRDRFSRLAEAQGGLTDAQKAEQRQLIWHEYQLNPDLWKSDALGRTATEWDLLKDTNWIDEDIEQWYAMLKKLEKADPEYRSAQLESWLEAHPGAAAVLYAEKSDLAKATDKMFKRVDKVFDRLDRTNVRLEAQKQAKDYEDRELGFLLKEQDQLMLEWNDFGTTARPPREGGKLGIVKDIMQRAHDNRTPEEKKEYARKQKWIDAMEDIADRSKTKGKFDPAKWAENMKKAPRWILVEYFRQNPGKEREWRRTQQYIDGWKQYHKFASAGNWDAANRLFDSWPQWVKDRYYAKNPGRAKKARENSKYIGYMKRWIGMFEAGNRKQAYEYFDRLPDWVKERYWDNHPGQRMSSARGRAYIGHLNKFFDRMDAKDFDGAEAVWKSFPDWVRRKYLADNPGSSLKDGFGGSGASNAKYREYGRYMQQWVDLTKEKGTEAGQEFFRSLPDWVQAQYLKRHPDKKLMAEDQKMVKLLQDYFLAEPNAQARMIADNPSLARWLVENDDESARIGAIQYLYRSLPDDPWVKRVFREKYPEVFSPEATGERSIQSTLSKLAEHPELNDAFLAQLEKIWAGAENALKSQLAAPKQVEMKRRKRNPRGRRSWSAKDVAERSKKSLVMEVGA
jgi:hypothetical protein